MAILIGKSEKGCFFQWGVRGTRYYFDKSSNISRGIARSKAVAQGKALRLAKQKAKEGV